MSTNNRATLDTCGCCETGPDEPIHLNRPGQSEIAYRIGTHATFLKWMMARLASQELPDGPNAGQRPLASLTSRATEDPIIALLDAGAVVYDVLSFYQERIANEGFLRPATERRSILELARSIGYELNPGVAAGTYLAFTVDDSDTTPDEAPIPAGTQIQSIPRAQDELPQTFETSEAFTAHVDWNVLKPRLTEPHPIDKGTTDLYLAGVATQLQPGDAILLVGDERESFFGSERWDFRIVKTVKPVPEAGYTYITWEPGLGHDSPTVHPADNPRVYVFKQKAALFGHNAPDWRIMPDNIKLFYDPEWDPENPDRRKTQWPDYEIQTTDQNLIDLDATYAKIVIDSWVILSKPGYIELYKVDEATTDSRTDYTLTAQVTRLKLDTNEHLSWFGLRDTVVYAQSEALSLSEKTITPPVTGTTIELDRVVSGLRRGQPLIVNGKVNVADEAVISEVVFVESTVGNGIYTTIVLQTPLENSYDRRTVTLYGNVVPATHGETVANEVLGGGDGARRNQSFTLNKSPLTYVSAATASGSDSALTLRVNNVAWQEVDSLYDQTANDSVYTVRLDDDGKTKIIFGDGKRGARLPTGQENIRATYRTGLGSEGEVDAGSLTLLKTRPFGIRSVTNSQAATGAADPETRDAARTNAPLTVLTLDRIVSLRDFEDFARAFTGIGKAKATNVWDGETYLVHLTIADDNGDAVPDTSDLYLNLQAAIDAARDPTATVLIDSYTRLTFKLEATIQYEARYLADDLQADVEAALMSAFSFDQRDFGQPVTAAEVISVIHQVEGVIAVDLDALYTTPPTGATIAPIGRIGQIGALGRSKLASVLPAQSARRAGADILPAELLLLDETGIALTLKAI